MKTDRRNKQHAAEEHTEDNHVLTQQELMAWWPFTRLDPKRFPKTPKQPTYPDGEEALL